MAGKAIPMGRTRPASDPWLTVTDGSWEWRVLKAYTEDPDKPNARWFCEVRSPFVPRGEMGDTYVRDIAGAITQRDAAVPDEALPSHLRRGGVRSRRQLEAEWDLLI